MSLAAGQQLVPREKSVINGLLSADTRLTEASISTSSSDDLSESNTGDAPSVSKVTLASIQINASQEATSQVSGLFTAFWPEIKRATSPARRASVEKAFSEQTAKAELLEPWQKEIFKEFLENYLRASDSRKIKFSESVTEPLETLLRALPHYHSKVESGVLADAYSYYQGSAKQFSAFIDHHCKLSRDPNFTNLQIGLRVIVRVGIHSDEAPLQIIKAFSEILGSPGFGSLTDKNQFTEFLRGLALNNWSIVSSLITLHDALEVQSNKDLAMQLCALSTLEGYTPRRETFGEALKPSVVDYLSLSSVPDSYLNLALTLYERADLDPLQKNISASKLCLLLEVCAYNPNTNTENVIRKISNEIFHGRSIDDLADVMLRNIDKSADNTSTRRLIEKIIRQQDFEEIAKNIQLLRDLHNADVPYDIPLQKGQQNYFKKQVCIFEQALECFDTFRRVRSFIDVIRAELRNFPDGHPGVMASFAHEMADVLKVHCSTGGYPGKGIDLSNLREENLFTADLDRPDDPLHRYLDEFECNLQTLRDFIGTRFVITDECIIIMGPSGARYKIGSEELCATFFADGPNNSGSNQCFLYPNKIISQMLSGTTHDFLDTAESCSGLEDLADKGMYPENLVIEARNQDRLFFDIGAATNIGGLSNSTGVFPLADHGFSWVLDSKLGLQDLDPWGNLKKMSLLRFPQLFEEHVSYHETLIGIIQKLGQSFKILENRYAAWKKGLTPDNSEKESGWISSIPAEHRHLRMLEFAYRWHIHLQSPEMANSGIENARLEFLTLGKLHEGPMSQFYLDIKAMKLVLPDGEIQLPRISQQSQPDDVDALVEELCFSKKASDSWNTHVRPYLAQLMPTISFT